MLLVPLVLLPLAAVIVRAWTIQQTEFALTEATRSVSRAGALTERLGPEQYRALMQTALLDANLLEGTEVLIRSDSRSYLIVLRRKVDSLLPGLSVSVERVVRVD
ncbi:MAG: hypothetical protein EB027_05280 [Actinobacteria bacterium]|nr:hypothetical protein [Actinomycetota bacterium]